jgi:hypothetical protein
MPEKPTSFTITENLLKMFRPLKAQSGDIHDRSYNPFKSQHMGCKYYTFRRHFEGDDPPVGTLAGDMFSPV